MRCLCVIASGGPVPDGVDERGSRGGDERGRGGAVGLPPVAEPARRTPRQRAARARRAAPAAALPARAAQEGKCHYRHLTVPVINTDVSYTGLI